MKSQSNSQSELDEILKDFLDEVDYVLEDINPPVDDKDYFDRPYHEAKAKLLQLALSIIGEDEKPDVQLTERAYMYSGEVEGRNKLRVELRQAFKEKFGG